MRSVLTTRKIISNFSGAGKKLLFLLFAGVLLSGCEARLDLAGVEKQQNNPIKRTDIFQAVETNDSTIVAVGGAGVILVSGDKGVNWQRHVLEGWPSLIDVTSCDNGNFAALAAEKNVYVSTDAGKNWQLHSLGSEETPQAITCDHANQLWVVGSFSTIISSDDHGESWVETTRDEDVIFTGIQFFDDSSAVIAGEYGSFLTSSDGGKNWDNQEPLPNEFYPEGMFFKDSQNGWVVGLAGKILKTEDAGQTWSEQESGIKTPLYGISSIGDKVCAVGGAGKLICHDGLQWQEIKHGANIRLFLRGIAAVDAAQFIVAGRAGALHLIDKKTLNQ